MYINKMKDLSYDELRAIYKKFLHSQDISKLTVDTAYGDTFYLWRKEGKDLFWNTVASAEFEYTAKNELQKTLSEHSKGNFKALNSSYLSHLRRFRLFLASDAIVYPSTPEQKKISDTVYPLKKKLDKNVPVPSIDQVELYLEKWIGLETYRLQEDAELCPRKKTSSIFY